MNKDLKYCIKQHQPTGFFSDFNTILACLHYFLKNDVKNFSAIWHNDYIQSSQYNMFNKFFFTTPIFDSYDVIDAPASISGSFWKCFNEHETYVDINKTLKHYNYFENPIYKQIVEDNNKRQFIPSKTLGVHIRGTDHTQHGPLLTLDYYLDQIYKKIKENNYKQVFIATDENRVIEFFKKCAGKCLIYHEDVIRSQDGRAFHTNLSLTPDQKDKLPIDILKEAITLSMCDEILVTSSNVSAYSIYIRPEIKYTFIDKDIQYH
jgi:hypothetical protein